LPGPPVGCLCPVGLTCNFPGVSGVPMFRYLPWVFILITIPWAANVSAEPTTIGATGLVYMPSAHIEEEGTLRFGLSNADPYRALWSSVSMFPWLELSARYTRIDGVPGFPGNTDFGAYKDKAFDAKLRLVRESRYLPDISIGTQDFTGTQLFKAHYFAASKHFGDFDVTLGYGADRIDGGFGGVRYKPSWNRNLGFVVEHDANDYRNDFNAALSGADQRTGGTTYAVEYKFGWIGTQLSYQHGDVGANLYVSIPLMRREFIPKIREPKPYSTITPEPAAKEWRRDTRYPIALARELDRQGFKDVHLGAEGGVLDASLTNTRIRLIGRAVGRAVRTMLLLGPTDVDEIRITYTLNDLPILTYRFSDLEKLRGYLKGGATEAQLDEVVRVDFSSPEYASRFKDDAVLRFDRTPSATPAQTRQPEEGRPTSLRPKRSFLSDFDLVPFKLNLFFNDPSGAFHYDTYSLLNYRKRVASGWYVNGAARLTLFEDVSDVTQESNSLLPHVRSDVALYKREGSRLTLNSLLLNKYAQLGERFYGRWSAGYYEEMFAGTGGQLLYLPKQSNWAFDLTVDWLKQRAPGESFGFRDYSVVTALGGIHYRFPSVGFTATARIGRFLAKDDGVRFEFKRMFRSGVEVGAWYTVTNGNDITSPGSPGDPYHDKGIFMSVPLASMLTADTQERASLTIVDFTRDVGQMVESPGDLYRLIERPLMLDSAEYTPLSELTR
jgi:hypothetical protein